MNKISSFYFVDKVVPLAVHATFVSLASQTAFFIRIVTGQLRSQCFVVFFFFFRFVFVFKAPCMQG